MSKIGTLNLSGSSGSDYTFSVYPYGTVFKSLGAIYYISRRTENAEGIGSHSNLYVGQTNNLSDRFNSHHKESCFLRNNANCISVLIEEDEDARMAIESDLIDSLMPPCNGQ
jgi:hypothetical protein